MSSAAHRLVRSAPLLAAAVAPVGCTGAEDVGGTSGSTSGFAPPDIAGSYVVAWNAPGCALPSDWVAGDLEISGDPGDLSWDFGEAAVPGSVDGTFAFELGGDAAVEGQTLSVEGSGTAYLDTANDWALDGDLSLSSSGTAGPCQAAFTAQASP